MKLHLPVQLFRAVIALMAVAMPFNASAEQKYTVADGQQLTLSGLDELDLDISGYNGSSLSSKVYGGAIYAKGTGSVTLEHYVSVLFNENYAKSSSSLSNSYAYGGAIYSYSGDITLSGNESVTFSGNYASSSSSYTRGGAIYSESGSITLSGNECVTFSGNCASGASKYAYARGGAISSWSGDITLSGNGSVTFSGNYASSSDVAYGGAIYSYSGDITLSGNESVTFSGNYASSSSSYTRGGAIYSESGSITLSGNECVTFSGNCASGASKYAYARGGAISSWSGDITLSGNGSVTFSGNYASSSDVAYGGAIYSAEAGAITLSGNESVLFEKNYEKAGQGTEISPYRYRLRSIYVQGDVYLAAKTGGHITFYDSVRQESGGTVSFNASYEDAEGTEQKAGGDIIFSGKYAKEHLDSIIAADTPEGELAREATAEEITNSQTSEFNSVITLYGGRLQVVDGARLKGCGLTVSEGSNATVLLRNSHMLHSGYDITFHSGTTLAIQGYVTLSANLTLKDGATLSFNLNSGHADAAALTLGSSTLNAGKINLMLNGEEALSEGLYKVFSITASKFASLDAWTAENISVSGSGYTQSATFDDLVWDNGVLYYKVDRVSWSNKSDDRLWNKDSLNWTRSGTDMKYTDGMVLYFGDEGAGTVSLVGELMPSGAVVNNSEGHDYRWEGSGNLTGDMTLTKQGSGSLIICTDNSYSGDTTVKGGTLVAEHKNALGSSEVILKGGTLEVAAEGFSNTIRAEGDSTLRVDTGMTLNLAAGIANTGTLTLQGNFNTDAMSFADIIPATMRDLDGNQGDSGYAQEAGYTLQVVDGGSVNTDAATITHKGKLISLSENGVAVIEGAIDYTRYHIGAAHTASAAAIAAKSLAEGSSLQEVTLEENGTLQADASVQVKATGGMIFLTDGTLAGSLENVTTLAGGGDIAVTFEGENTLVGLNYAITTALNNSGTLTMSGSFNADAVTPIATESSTRVALDGTIGDSGFVKSESILLQLVTGGGSVISDAATITYKGDIITIDNHGTAIVGGGILYNQYHVGDGHSASVTDIIAKAESEGSLLDNITMEDGGYLEVDGDATVNATGGNIDITADSTLGGSIKDTDITTAEGDYKSDISADITGDSSLTINGGDITLSGDNNYTGGTVINGGSLTAGDDTALGSGSVTVNGGTLDLNDNSIGNDIILNDGNLTGSDNYNGNLSIGGDNVSVEGGYTLGAGKVLEVATGGTEFGSDLTLAGGTLLFKGAPLTVDGEVSFTEGTTTLVDLRQWEGELTDGLTLAVLGSDVTGWTEDCLELIGMNDMSLGFDAATGTLTLQIEGQQPAAETITWLGAKKTVWQTGKAGWMNATTGHDAVFETGADVIFTQSGKVTIAGAVEPGSVIVAGDKNITFKSDKKNPGRIVGDTTLTKRGKGKLTLNDGNFYSGGTVIEAGTVVAGGASAFGRGDITISGGTLDLKSKAVTNDITLSGAATIKSGKKYGGVLTLEGDLLKGSVLNVAEKAELKSGTVNGTLRGIGTVAVTGDVTLDTKGKITTNSLDVSGTLHVSTKGMSMNSKASAITVEDGGLLASAGALKAYSLEVNGGEVQFNTAKATSVTLGNNLVLRNGASMNLSGKMTVGNLSMENASLALFDPSGKNKAMGLTAKGALTLTGSSLMLNGKLTAKDLTLTDSYIKLTSTKVQTITAKNSLTLSGDNTIIFDFDAANGKKYKLFSFKAFTNKGADLYELLGWENNGSYTLTENAKDITLTVLDSLAWESYMDELATGQKAVSAADDAVAEEETAEELLTAPQPVAAAAVDPLLRKAADTLVQSTWGTVNASRAFGDTIAARGAHATLLAEGKGAAWLSVMGGSSRISTDGDRNGADFTLSGAAFGVEGRVTEKSTLGVAIGNSWGKVSTFSAFPVDQDSMHIGIYGNHTLTESLTLSWMATHTRTESELNLLGLPYEWAQDALQLDARLTWATAISDKTTLSVFGGLQYLATDSGESNGLSTGSVQNLRGELGIGASHKCSDSTLVFGELSFVGDMVRNNPTADLGGMRLRGSNPGRAGINLSVGAAHRLSDDWSLNASYSFELMQNVTSHSLNVGASYSF
ncbi:MAG: autotransporter-associated beta strand repeat-containing protein [Akkermansia sp.]|nr:autotransporter-associated beta strand repeat-containing protein [Akkermansia sp.]